MNKNITKLLLSAALMLCCTFSAWAGLGTPPDDEIWYTSRDGNVIAPYYDYVFGASIQSNTYNDGKGVIKFNRPVTQVGEYAFYKTYLTSMSLPNTVKSIGYRAFYWMNYMKEISLGNSVETISNDAFRDCDGLETIDIPASVTSIGEYAFYDCNVLKFVAIGSGVTNIGKYAFYNCNELKSVAIDGNGVALGYEAFYDCEKLESVSFLGDTPPSSFGEYCFYDCSPNLKYHVLEECYDRYNNIGILNGNVVAGPPYNEIWYTTNNGGTAGHTFTYNTLPSLNAYMGNHGVQFFDGNPPEFKLLNNCFYYCNNLVSVVLPSSINHIGESAFESCENLVSVSLPNSVTSIDQHAFYKCFSLQTITIPESVYNIGPAAFFSCDELRSVTILGTINSIDSEAFLSCDELRSMTILGTINSIGSQAFSSCRELNDIFYFGDGTPAVVTGWDDGSFLFCPATIYVKDTAGHADWGDRPVCSWRSGKGDGSRENPLEIENYINLYGFALEVSVSGDNDLCGKLTRDIVGNSNVLDANGNPNPGTYKEWLPIGSSDKVFCGEFNGNGHTISGLYHNYYYSGSCVGLFGRTGEGAYIHDLGLVDSYMSGGQWNAGICGDLAYGHIDNCYNAATVAWGGGIAGSCWMHARISNCHNVGHIFSSGSGIANDVFNNPNVTYSVENCYALEGVSNSAINNNYGTTYNVEVKSAAAFTSGEVCWLLNGSKIDTKWRQQLGRDSYPVFFGNLLVVYDIGEYYNEGMCNQSPDHRHLLTGTNGIIPATTSTGKYGYYTCTYCHNKFMDKHGCIPATEESLTIPKAKDNEIWYTTSNHQKLTPNKTDAFGTAYNDANNVYELGVGLMQFDGNVTSIGSEAFHNCYDLTSITIPNSVTSIGYEAFMFCTNLTSITIPSSVTSIGDEAFDACHSITSIDIPSGVTSIGKFAIYNCLNLSSVTFHSLPAAGQYAVYGCDKLSAKSLNLTDNDKPYIGTSLANYPGFTGAQYHRTLEQDKWGTIVLPFAPTGGMEGLEFYELKEMTTASGGSLVFTKVETVKAGVPYLFRNTSSTSDFTLTNTAQPNTSVGVTVGISSQTVGDVTLKGSFQQTQLDGAANGNLYYLKGGEFYHANGKINIAPFRAYIEANGSSGVQARNFLLLVDDDEVTAIADILDEDGAIEEAEAIYDLGGRRLDAPVKGQVNIVRLASGKTIKRMF